MLRGHFLIIHNFPALFNILNEVKDILNFNIKSINGGKIDNKYLKNGGLVISTEKKMKIDNQILINDYPINLFKLIDLINIQFLKNKYYQQNNIKIGKYSINLNSRIMKYEIKTLPLTEKETDIIIFLNKSNIPISINDLQINVWGHKSKLETHTVETHVYRLRKKILKAFGDDNFIESSKKGYKIN